MQRKQEKEAVGRKIELSATHRDKPGKMKKDLFQQLSTIIPHLYPKSTK